MEILLKDNLKRLRKERGLTQEALAESLGVTVGAVYKWENGRSAPELTTLIEIAALFGVSIDVLVGYRIEGDNSDKLAKKISALGLEKRYREAITEAERALLLYPNDFYAVYSSGELYALAGIEKNEEKYLRRAIELLTRAVLFLSQSKDSSISEPRIQSMIAQCYIALGKHERGLEILKKYNVCGVFDSLISIIYTEDCDQSFKEAEPYMVSAFANIVTSAIRTMRSYANYYQKSKLYEDGRDAFLWLSELLSSIKIDKSKVAYTDKLIASCYARCADLSLMMGRWDEAEAYMKRAVRMGAAFDRFPTYKMQNIKFCVMGTDDATAYDDLGSTAIESVEKAVKESKSEGLYEMFLRISEEEEL